MNNRWLASLLGLAVLFVGDGCKKEQTARGK